MTMPGNPPTLAQMLSGGGAYFKFENVGDVCEGTIVTVHDPEPQTDINNQFVYNDRGQQKYQFRMDLQTDYRDREGDDNGLRTVYCKGFLIGAITDGLRAAGAKTLDPGARVKIEVVGQKPPPKLGMRPVNLFQVWYQPPIAGASPAANELLAQQQPVQQPAPQQAYQQQPPVQQVAPTPVQQAVPAPTGPPSGITESAWAAMPDEYKRQILATQPGGQPTY